MHIIVLLLMSAVLGAFEVSEVATKTVPAELRGHWRMSSVSLDGGFNMQRSADLLFEVGHSRFRPTMLTGWVAVISVRQSITPGIKGWTINLEGSGNILHITKSDKKGLYICVTTFPDGSEIMRYSFTVIKPKTE
jgi:hypothetical protein